MLYTKTFTDYKTKSHSYDKTDSVTDYMLFYCTVCSFCHILTSHIVIFCVTFAFCETVLINECRIEYRSINNCKSPSKYNQLSTSHASFISHHSLNSFYSASALLAMQSAVLARGILSVCPSVRPSVCPSVTFRYCVQMNEDTTVRFSASGRTIPLVSGEVKVYPDIRRGSPPAGALK